MYVELGEGAEAVVKDPPGDQQGCFLGLDLQLRGSDSFEERMEFAVAQSSGGLAQCVEHIVYSLLYRHQQRERALSLQESSQMSTTPGISPLAEWPGPTWVEYFPLS